MNTVNNGRVSLLSAKSAKTSARKKEIKETCCL